MLIRPADAFAGLRFVTLATQGVEAGAALGRTGRALVEHDGVDIWIRGQVSACIEGTLRL